MTTHEPRQNMIAMSSPSLGAEELTAVARVLESGWLGFGGVVLEFERRVREYLDVERVVAVQTGTAALHVSLDALGVGAGDEVLVPSLTFCSAIQVITALGARPVFCDVNADTFLLDIRDVEGKITDRTRALMPVHYAGNPCDMDALVAVCRRRQIALVEDAAHAFGATWRGRRLGGFGDATCFSFDPIKVITCGEGGVVATARADLADRLQRKRLAGINRDSWARRKEGGWSYEVTEQGYRYHMSNLNAAIGLAQLDRLDGFVKHRRRLVGLYNQLLTDVPAVVPIRYDLEEGVPFIYVVKIADGRREAVRARLQEKGIETGVHYPPNHLQPFFESYRVELPVTERISHEMLTLPLHCRMEESDVRETVSALKESLAGGI